MTNTMRTWSARLAVGLGAMAISGLAWCCTPPPPPHPSVGFVRHDVQHLPQNARGVMFFAPNDKLRPEDIELASKQDRRALSVRIQRLPPASWVRIEPVHGFQPGATYQFRYRRAHRAWAYPDRMTVAIDHAVATTDGAYRIDAAPRPAHRVILVPTSAGSCVEPVTAVVQEFSYALPASLKPYQDALVYDATLEAIPAAPAERLWEAWPARSPELYVHGKYSMADGFSNKYTARRNAVVAGCAPSQPRGRLSGEVRFPELDAKSYSTPAIELDLSRNVVGTCDELSALVRTVDWKRPDASLVEICHMQSVGSYRRGEVSLAHFDVEEWEREFAFLYAMSPTCNLVALTHLLRSGQFSTDPHVLQRLGAALATGTSRPKPQQQRATWHGLDYLVSQQPPGQRAGIARNLLGPLQPALVSALSGPAPVPLAPIANLLLSSGKLPPDLRLKLQHLANGSTKVAAYARTILSTQ